MSVVRYEELDQLAGELLPERTLLSVVYTPFVGTYYPDPAGYYHPVYSPYGAPYPDPGMSYYQPAYSPYGASYSTTTVTGPTF